MINKVVWVNNYAADYGGNFLASFKYASEKLEEDNIKVTFIFPEFAHSKEWEVDLSMFEVKYVDLNDKIALTNSVLSSIDGNTIIHTNFIDRKRLIQIDNAVLIYQEHMFPKDDFKHIFTKKLMGG